MLENSVKNMEKVSSLQDVIVENLTSEIEQKDELMKKMKQDIEDQKAAAVDDHTVQEDSINKLKNDVENIKNLDADQETRIENLKTQTIQESP